MIPVFISTHARVRDSWREAFPQLLACDPDTVPGGVSQAWLLAGTNGDTAGTVARLRRQLAGCPVIVLADTPTEDEGIAVLAAGASGYCNGHADAQVLRQIASVVQAGGVWVGQKLMQRLLVATVHAVPVHATVTWRDGLTAREQETGELLARGASNKEIARQLGITERTVKAHVGAMLEKLGARDRLKLALIINGQRRVSR